MPLRYPTIDSWLVAQLKRLNEEWDNYHLNTGEEGTGKSTWSRKVARRLDHLMRDPKATVQMRPNGPYKPLRDYWQPAFEPPPPFTMDGVCFGQDQLLEYLNRLPHYGIGIGDEIEGHKRLAMHGHRQVLLDHTKEGRFFFHNVWLNYPHPDQFERDLFRTRLKWWEHHDRRGHVVIRERPHGKIHFDRDAEMSVLVTWPVVARFPWTSGNDPWKPAYEAKKLKRARERAAARLALIQGDQPTPEPAAAAPAEPRPMRIPPGILDMVLGELKR